MDAEALVLALLDALPKHEILGKKRLQKLAFFATESGLPTDVSFFLHDYGPFSPKIAAATDILSFIGDISEEDTQIGRTKRFVKRYRLPETTLLRERLPERVRETILKLHKYTTLELEIASTIRFFCRRGSIYKRR